MLRGWPTGFKQMPRVRNAAAAVPLPAIFCPLDDLVPVSVSRGLESRLHAGGTGIHLSTAGTQTLGHQSRHVPLPLPGEHADITSCFNNILSNINSPLFTPIIRRRTSGRLSSGRWRTQIMVRLTQTIGFHFLLGDLINQFTFICEALNQIQSRLEAL